MRMSPVAAGLALATLASLTTSMGAGPALAAPPTIDREATGNVCLDTDISAALVGAAPGRILAPPQDVTVESGIDYGRVYRFAYATRGPGDTLEGSCALVAVPEAPAIDGVVTWAHGTVGLKETCQPSMKPASLVAPMPTGIGAPTRGGAQADGALDAMLRAGKAVVATDYYAQGMGGTALQRYVLGVPQGLAILDSARALTHGAPAFGLAPIADDAALPLATWGHSQGGGAALWAGQLAADYLELQGDRSLELAGVAALAPATQFTTSPGQPSGLVGYHLGDRNIYNMAPGIGVPFPIGAVLFSLVTGAWSQVGDATAGPMPVGPTPSVSMSSVLTQQGLATAPAVASSCLSGSDLITVTLAVAKYLNPDRSRMFAAPLAGSKKSGRWVGAIDATCADPARYSQGIQDWCSWMQFNNPGPYGVNPYSKVPVDAEGSPVPVYIGQGRNDRIMWCVDAVGSVSQRNCLAAQFQASMAPEYCPAQGSLTTDYFAGIDHLQVPGAAAVNPATGAYRGSPLERFITGSLTGSLPAACTTSRLPNPPSK